MKTFTWQEGLGEKLDQLCAVFPEVIRSRWKDRLVYNTEKIAAYEDSGAITSDIFWRSVYEVLPGGYEPLILRVREPERIKADMAQSRAQEEIAPGDEPVRMLCWSSEQAPETVQAEGKTILALNASARKGGNTDIVIDELLRGCKDCGAGVQKVYLSDCEIKPCTGCRACRKGDVSTICTLRDDMTEDLYARMYAADGIITGFPIYTARENGIMANFMDRWDCLSNPYLTRKMPPGKKSVVVCSWMWPNPAAYDPVVEQMVILLKLHGVETSDVLVVSGTRGKHHGRGVVKNHPELLQQAYAAGRRFASQISS